MLSIVGAHPLPFIIALIIGIATGWWIWANRETAEAEEEPVEPYQVDPEPAPAPAPEPAPEPAPAPVAAPLAAAAVGTAAGAAASSGAKPKIAAAVGEPDDLTRIKGIGPQLNDLCNSLGVSRFDQIAKWNAEDVAEVDQYLKIKGRIDRDDWVGQAKLLCGMPADGKPNIAAAVGEPDDLTQISGIGPKLNDLCHSLGVMRFDQIAAWGTAEIAEVDQYLKIKGRITRDDWVGQAKKLVKG